MTKEEMIGQRFGRLVVVEQDFDYVKEHNLKSTKQNYWKCQCDCGNFKTVVQTSLIGGKTQSCGCLSQESRHKKEDLMGQTFGQLTVIGDAEHKGGRTAWVCKCTCGNICVVKSTDLKRGNTKSCGCLHVSNGNKTARDLTGQVFGRLTALYPTEKRNRGFVVWQCQCECGNLKEVDSTHLIRGQTQSCGCLVSTGESEIINILQVNGIAFETQKTFDDAYEIKGHPYRYDFYLPDYNRLIEFDGIQHYPRDRKGSGWDTEEHYEKTKQRDKIKNEYALSRGIDLIRIPYWERDNITLDMILGNQYLIFNK